MNDPSANGDGGGWALEVVRGRDVGRVFALIGGESVLGNAPGDPRRGVDLSGQEGDSPRRMAGRHAALEADGRGLAVRDLESPGGTFVNRRRVLPGRSTALRPGDVLQLGAVQLRVVARSSPDRDQAKPPPATPAGPFAFEVAGGSTCRSWDDFLAVSAQRWDAVRDELTTGRLAAFLASIGRADLAPSPSAPGTPDERLDAWLGRLPSTRPGRPELDVYPSRLVIRATPGGGTLRRSVQVANVGHRLLRATARVEPPGLAWLKIAPELPGGAFTTVEGIDLPIEVTVPATLPAPLTADLVIEGNGGTKRVAVVLEAKAGPADPVGATPEPAGSSDLRLGALIARQSPGARVATWSLAALAVRLLIGVAGGSIGEDAMIASGPEAPRLGGVALALAAAGALAGAGLASRRGGPREAPTGAFAGGCAGVVAAAALVAACRSIEPLLGSWATSIPAVCLLWAALGAAPAAASMLVVKGEQR